MTRIAVHARMTAEAGRRDELVDVLKKLLRSVGEHEPGCLVYALHTDRDDPDAVWYYELFEDEAALAAHKTNPTLEELRPQIKSLLADMQGSFGDVVGAVGHHPDAI